MLCRAVLLSGLPALLLGNSVLVPLLLMARQRAGAALMGAAATPLMLSTMKTSR
jgi:hypothetical protein